MFGKWRQRRAEKRLKPGDGRELTRFRWWQLPFRALFYLRLPGDGGAPSVYAVDVRHWQNQSSGDVQAQLYLDGRQHAVSRLPAFFPVQGGTIEVRMSAFGLKRCHYVPAEGAEYPLTPDPVSAEGRRARLDRAHPALSRCIGVLSAAVLIVGLMLLGLQLVDTLTHIEPVARRIGAFTAPVDLNTCQNIALGLVAATASTERALRLRYSVLLDGGAG